MRKEIKNSLIIFIGGLLMLIGLYYSYLYAWAAFILIAGVVVFIYGLYMDIRK